jgi:Leucine-rich repeat (LRR) protein/NCAIR mutase (PurE)-related protein
MKTTFISSLFALLFCTGTMGQTPVITMTTTQAIGTSFSFILSASSLEFIDVDFGNGKESFMIGGSTPNTIIGTLSSQTIEIYGTGIASLNCSNKKLTKLEIENIRSLVRIDCFNNSLTTLDLTECKALEYVDCHQNNLTNIDLIENSKLTALICNNNPLLATLNISWNTKLVELICNNNPLLTKIDVTENIALTKLICNNNNIETLDVSENLALIELNCDSNKLKTIDVSNNTELTKLRLFDNNLTELNVSLNTKLTTLDCSKNQLDKLDVTTNTALAYFGCGGNPLKTLNVTNNRALVQLVCFESGLTVLNLSNNKALKWLSCRDNQLETLNVSNNEELLTLSCPGNQLSLLNLNVNKNLTKLDCHDNQISTLKINENTVLTELKCDTNRLTELNVSNNTKLNYLSCHNNQLTTLNVRNNTELTYLRCSDNLLTKLDISNNTALQNINCQHNLITSLDVFTSGQNLYCRDNLLSFATLPVNGKGWTVYNYKDQKPFPILKDINLSGEIDLSDQYIIIGNTTDYTWKTKGGTTLTPGTDYELTNGKTKFLITQTDSVYCEMTNTTYNNLILKTTCTLVSNKKTQTITFNKLPEKYANVGPFDITASSGSGLSVIFTSSNSSIASITDNTITVHKAGRVIITAEFAGNNEWAPAKISQELVINKVPQIITFNELPLKYANDGSFVITASSGSGSEIPVTFESSDTEVASIESSDTEVASIEEGNKVIIHKAGTIDIIATQAGNDIYESATVTQELKINKVSQTIIFGELPEKSVNDAPFDLIASASSDLPVTFKSSDDETASIEGNRVTIHKAGNIIITATQAGNNIYEPTTLERTLTITTATGMNEAEESKLIIFPNPVADRLYIKGEETENSYVSIFNFIGTKVWSGVVKQQSINIPDLPAGNYLLKITGRDKRDRVTRFVKQ